MPFDDTYGTCAQSVRIPIHMIDAAYGPDNFDKAGDDVIYCLRTIADSSDQYDTEFAIDTDDNNPWHHAMIVTIPNISRSHYKQLLKLLRTFKLI